MRRPAEYFTYCVWLATVGVLVMWLPLIVHRTLDPDEFEHAHAAWCAFRGMVPYRDFFEHHTPWYYYLLRPLFQWFDVARSFDSARHFILSVRGLSLVFAALSIVIVSRIASALGHGKEGALAGLLLVSQPIFVEKAIEIRPDMPALTFFLLALWLLVRWLDKNTDSAAKEIRYLVGSGLCLGGAVLCTQKMLFVLPGILLGLFIWCICGLGPKRFFARFLMTLAFLACVCVPVLVTWAAFAAQHAGGEFIANNFILNAKWRPIETGQLPKLVLTSWPILVLSVVGAGLALSRFVRSRGRLIGELLLLCIVVGLFAGLAVMPSAHSQYYLMPLPLLCLLAAQGLLSVIERTAKAARPVLLVLTLIALAILPARALRDSYAAKNDAQWARLRFVFENTGPDDVVMDGWQGLGVFRTHAFYYFFLHAETLAMLPHADWMAYLNALEHGRIRPRLIAMDPSLFALGPRFQDFVRRNYRTSDGFFYFRNGLWRRHPAGMLNELRGY